MSSPNIPNSPSSSLGFDSSWLTSVFGLSMVASLFSGVGGSAGGMGAGGLKLLLLGTVVEFGRRLVQWFIERFRLQYSITAEFSEGDPVYDWIINFITQEKVWRRSKDFRVSAKSSQRRYGVASTGSGSTSTTTEAQTIDSAEYVPTYDLPQIFWWNRYWVEIKRTKAQMGSGSPFVPGGGAQGASIFLTIYTLDMTVLSKLVEDAKKKYYEASRPHVIVHSVTAHSYGPKFFWNNVKQKPRRPLNSIVLPDGTLDGLIADVRDFLKMEDWYMSAGIPHRRGYLLFGPPGTGKSSTIHAIAGELTMEIYAISLAANFVDDTFLEQAVSSVPKGSILLIEDIDCAFSREDDDDDMYGGVGAMLSSRRRRGHRSNKRSAVTLSGLLNILDGVGSEEGKIFFATTNYVDNLDAALLRPGRIDRKVEYKLATDRQASALFNRFYPVKHVTPESLHSQSQEKSITEEEKLEHLEKLNKQFTSGIPEFEFSTAELQGYLLSCKMMPEKAANGIREWVEEERRQKEEKERRIEAKKRGLVEKREKKEMEQLQNTLAKMNEGSGSGNVVPGTVIPSSIPIPAPVPLLHPAFSGVTPFTAIDTPTTIAATTTIATTTEANGLKVVNGTAETGVQGHVLNGSALPNGTSTPIVNGNVESIPPTTDSP